MHKLTDSLCNYKPHKAMNSLVTSACELGGERVFKKGVVFFDFAKGGQSVFFIISGKIGIYRKSDRLLIQECEAPSISGLANIFHQQTGVIIKAHTDVVVLQVPRDGLMDAIEAQNLWRELADVLSWMINCYNILYIQQVGLNSYQVIKHHLLLLNKKSPVERFSTTAVKYITDRTLLSRSGVMSILRRLNQEGHIVLNDGRLMSITHLPDDI